MIVIDVEATGTDPHKHSIVSIGAVDFDKPEERIYIECQMWQGAHVDPAALVVNGYSEVDIRDKNKLTEAEAVKKFFEWYEKREDMTPAGQNPLFDISFLQAAAQRAHVDFRVPHRSIDQHTLTYSHMIRNGVTPPMKNKKSGLDSDTIMAYVGIPAEPKPHIAINGALWETEAFSRLLYNKNLLPEFSQYKIPW